jgi:hypothetical protein
VLLVEGDHAAFVLPVVFAGAARHDLDAGTIYHAGVIQGNGTSGSERSFWHAEPMHC